MKIGICTQWISMNLQCQRLALLQRGKLDRVSRYDIDTSLPAARVVCLHGSCLQVCPGHRRHHPLGWGQVGLASTPDRHLWDVGYFWNMGRHHEGKDGMVAGCILNVTESCSWTDELNTCRDDLCLSTSVCILLPLNPSYYCQRIKIMLVI